MPTYYLPLEPGAKKQWGTPEQSFWCCHGTLVQMHTMYPELVCYADDRSIVISQFIPCEIQCECGKVVLELDTQGGQSQSLKTYPTSPATKPDTVRYNITAETGGASIKIRKPWWAVSAKVNGQEAEAKDGFIALRQPNSVAEFGKEIQTVPMLGDNSLAAYMDGPVVLAGLCGCENRLSGGFRPLDAKHWMTWRNDYVRDGIRFMPLYEVTDQVYTVYFKQ
jgi:DUF1680 family protein